MKKNILSVIALSILSSAMVFTSCNKENNTPPVITVSGPNPYTVVINTLYTDPAVTAVDNSGNNLTADIVNNLSNTNPNMSEATTYTISYFVSDANGNTANATRTVYVTLTPAYLAGHWNVTDLVDTTHTLYTDSLYTSATPGNVNVMQFADYAGAALYFTLSGNSETTVTMPKQEVLCGPLTNKEVRSFYGSGNVSTDGSTITINYNVVVVTTTDTITGIETYTNKTARVRK
jgi:hypothetical protein